MLFFAGNTITGRAMHEEMPPMALVFWRQIGAMVLLAPFVHRELRRKSALRSGLEEVPGVGPKRRSRLLTRFGSLKGIRAASLEELGEILPDRVARALREYLGQP